MTTKLLLLLALSALLCLTVSAHSWWEGTWKIQVSKGGQDRTIKCGNSLDQVVREFSVDLLCPDLAIDEFGNEGYWTDVLGYGLEIVIQGRKFYTFPWKRRTLNDTDDLKWFRIPVGWSHDLLGNNWACFAGVYDWSKKPKKEQTPPPQKPLLFEKHSDDDSSKKRLFRSDLKLISKINAGQSFWKAERYPEFENMTEENMINLAGGKYSKHITFPKTSPLTDDQKNDSAYPYLPKNFDWRNYQGKNFVGPIRNQGHCGSCYAFAATAMHESRVRILTRNAVTPTYSPQDMVDCSPYAFGCGGGILFSEAKFAEDYGYAEESCSAYRGYEQACTSLKCKRSYSTDYEMIGTHYGGCNEFLMRLAIYRGGPIVVGYAVFSDFMYYKSGIYYHYGPNYRYGGHAVAIVGWGEDEKTGTKFWIAKNSWGATWGESGYFRFIRGLNDCDIESMAWQATPIL